MPGQMQQLLRRLSPTKRVLGVFSAQRMCAAGLHRNDFGMALSDPYLSLATPLVATPLAVFPQGDAAWWRRLADEHDAKLVLGFGDAADMDQLHRICDGAGLAFAKFHSIPTIELVIQRASEHPELYDFLSEDAEDRLRALATWDHLQPDHLAAVLLNEALWEHSGGWHNTFG
ncbi:hypothetical protein M885DRAFT_542099 [Pelagophyceae sp. CCMP2097]|nr:hypothetical protein M885DRAFT_542099 [Pelagophyceae sp. CCMP2097]|mmetsp:Transcript_32313/g.108857  ORF Transcript_32313/g.108857 Transcript_32313/m.108857 type:complete len:173 (+) Transcript_32313:261-779(+)